MRYTDIYKGIFKKRINRFIAVAEINGVEETVHVKNTGRLSEIFKEGVAVYLEKVSSEERKTKFDLVAAVKNNMLINVDSQAPNKVFYEYLKIGKFVPGITHIKPECKYKNSRFDFYAEAGERKIYIEVKGVTLENNRVVRFPDAPTERGIKHINELIEAKKEGYEAYIVFVVQIKEADVFMPNDDTHKAFGDALRNARDNGVSIKAYNCDVYENGFDIAEEIKIKLE